MKLLKSLFVIIASLLLYRCGSNLDLSGKGARMSCFYLDTDSLRVQIDCGDSRIARVKIFENTGPKQYYGRLLYQHTWNDPVKTFVLPMPKDSIAHKYIQLELYLASSGARESYDITVDPGDIEKKHRIIARYFGH